MNLALAGLLVAFSALKGWLATAAINQLRLHRAGVAGVDDPRAGHARPWMFWAWVGWRYAAAILALASAGWLLTH